MIGGSSVTVQLHSLEGELQGVVGNSFGFNLILMAEVYRLLLRRSVESIVLAPLFKKNLEAKPRLWHLERDCFLLDFNVSYSG